MLWWLFEAGDSCEYSINANLLRFCSKLLYKIYLLHYVFELEDEV